MNQPDATRGGRPPGAPVGTAVLKFERGEMKLELFRREEGFVWYHDRKPFGPPLATSAAAVQFLKDLCELYSYTPDLNWDGKGDNRLEANACTTSAPTGACGR